jgi:hypothetical protein
MAESGWEVPESKEINGLGLGLANSRALNIQTNSLHWLTN